MRLSSTGAWFGALSVLFTAAACGDEPTSLGRSAGTGASGGTANSGAGAPGAGKPSAGAPAQAGTGASSAGTASGVGGSSSGGASGAGGSGAMASTGGMPNGTGGAMSGAGGSGASAGTLAGGGSAGSGSGGSAGQFGSGTLTLTNLKVEPNPNMTLSCFVSWTTAEPAASEVDFGEADYELRVRDATPVTEHRVLVIGMHAETAYKLRAFSGNAQGTGSLEGTFTTGKLPSGLPTPKLQLDELPAEQKGWLLTNIQTSSLSSPAFAVMYDEKGLPVWYFIQGTHGDTRGDVSTELLPSSNTVLVGPTSGEPGREVDLSGKVVWEGPANSNTVLMSHFLGKTSKGNYLLNYELDKAITAGSAKVDDQRLVEITPSKDVVWEWKMSEHVQDMGTREELCHGNMLVLDEAANVLYYNCRWVGLFKIDRASGDILWRMGGSYDKTSIGPGDFSYDPPASQFSDAHEPELHADGTILFYDNGGFAQGGTMTKYHSRIVEYQVDQTAKKATRTFEFPGDFAGVDSWYKDSWYSPYWGDADVLANGNILVTAAVRSASASSRFFEVTRQGKVMWELVMPANNGVFKAQRLLPPPLVEKMP